MSNFASNRDLPSRSSDDSLCTPITISSKRSDLPPFQSESERFDFAIHGLSKTARRIKEASRHLPLVSSLKTTMDLLIIALEYIHVANKNRDVWTIFLECLGDCMKTVLEKVEMLSPNDELCTGIQRFEGSLKSIVREMDCVAFDQTNWVKAVLSSRSIATRIQDATIELNSAYNALQVELSKHLQGYTQGLDRESTTKYQDSDNKTPQFLLSDEVGERIKHSDTNQTVRKHQSQCGVEYHPTRSDNPLQRNQNRVNYQEVHQTVLLRATEDRDGHGGATVDTGDQDGIEELLRFDYIEACGEALGHPLNEKQSDMANEIIEWSSDWNAKPIFNVVDMSGSGMSILSQHLVRTWSREDLLIGRFFFSASTSKTGKGLASTLARDIALSIPFLRQPILNARSRNANLETYTLQKQLEALVFTPLMALRKRSIIVIDALDQCCQVDRGTFLESLRRFFASYSPELNCLKIFLTCRPEQDILWKFGQKGYRRLVQQTNFSADLPDEVCFDASCAPDADECSGPSVAEHEADSCHQPQTTSDKELTDSSSMAKGLTEDDGPDNAVGIQEGLENSRKRNDIVTQNFSFDGVASNWLPGREQGRSGGIAIGLCAMNGGRVFGTGNTITIRGNSVAYTAVHGIGSEVNITNSNVVLEAFSQ